MCGGTAFPTLDPVDNVLKGNVPNRIKFLFASRPLNAAEAANAIRICQNGSLMSATWAGGSPSLALCAEQGRNGEAGVSGFRNKRRRREAKDPPDKVFLLNPI